MDKICVFGAGAIGSFIAKHLIQGGAQVSIVARGAHLAAIRAQGIQIRDDHGSTECIRPSNATDDPRTIGPQDAVFVTVKTTSLSTIAPQIKPLMSKETPVLFVGNGIPWWYADAVPSIRTPMPSESFDPGCVVHKTIGVQRVIAGLAYCACTVVAPGVILAADYPNSIVLGEIDGRTTERVRSIADTLAAGGLPCRISNDIRADVWGKLLTNLASGPICLLSRSTMRRSFLDPVIHKAAIRLVEEGRRVAEAALGRPLNVDAEDIVERLGRADHKPSILQDMESSRPLETETLFDIPQRFARGYQIDTPMLDVLLALSRLATNVADTQDPRASSFRDAA